MIPRRSKEVAPRNGIAENVARNVTMSSREIAELVGSRHDNVKASIERLAARGVIELPAMQEIPTTTKPVATYVFAGEKGKRDSIIVVAQLSPEFTAALVDRWQELDYQQAPRIPQTLSEALRLAADQAEQIEQQQKALAIAALKAAFVDQYVEATGSMSFRQAAKLLNANERRFEGLPALPVVEYQQQIGAVLGRGEVSGIGQVVGDVQLHVRKSGHYAASSS